MEIRHSPAENLVPVSVSFDGYTLTAWVKKVNEMAFRNLMDDNMDEFRDLVDHIDITTEDLCDNDIPY